MKKLQTMLALLLMSLPTFLLAQDSRFSVEPQYPQQGEKIRVSFNPKGTELEGEKNISAIVYWTEKNGLKVHEMPMTKSGSAFIGSYDLEKTATALAFTFIAGDKQDNNDKKGYVIPVYDDKKQVVPFANKALYKLYGDWDAHTIG